MATLSPVTRQPFAPINASRLQNLTSLKNRQNALPTSLASPSKRKAVTYEEDFENIDPIIFASPKRSKGQDGIENLKPSTFMLIKAAPTFKDFAAAYSPVKPNPISSRPTLQPRSPAAQKLKTTTITTKPTLSAPAGRSPTRKRIGILNRRRTDSAFKRVDPPKFAASGPSGAASAAPFSIAAALSGTIPSYREKHASTSSWASKTASIPRSILEPEHKSGWFFDIHEDTPEETMTNLMEHGACTLDISSDEEVERRTRDERGKENVPPLDDISQTSSRMPATPSLMSDNIAEAKASSRIKSQRRRKEIEDGAIEIDRSPLGDLEAEEFYAEGCSKEDVVLVADEEGEVDESYDAHHESVEQPRPYSCMPEEAPSPVDTLSHTFDFSIPAAISLDDVDALMTKSDTEAPEGAKLFEPLEKAEEGFEVWESASAKGEGEDEVC